MSSKAVTEFIPLNIAILTVSDTRTLEEDTSGQLLADSITEFGKILVRLPCSRARWQALLTKLLFFVCQVLLVLVALAGMIF